MEVISFAGRPGGGLHASALAGLRELHGVASFKVNQTCMAAEAVSANRGHDGSLLARPWGRGPVPTHVLSVHRSRREDTEGRWERDRDDWCVREGACGEVSDVKQKKEGRCIYSGVLQSVGAERITIMHIHTDEGKETDVGGEFCCSFFLFFFFLFLSSYQAIESAGLRRQSMQVDGRDVYYDSTRVCIPE